MATVLSMSPLARNHSVIKHHGTELLQRHLVFMMLFHFVMPTEHYGTQEIFICSVSQEHNRILTPGDIVFQIYIRIDIQREMKSSCLRRYTEGELLNRSHRRQGFLSSINTQTGDLWSAGVT